MKIRGAFSAMALTALLAIPLFGFTNHSTSIHAANIGLAQNTWHGSWENKVGIDKWDAHPSKIYMRHGKWIVRGRIKTYKKGNHTFMVKPVFDAPGEIIGMDGNKHVPNSTITRVLNKQVHYRGTHRTIYKYGYYKHGHYHYYKTGYFRNGKWIRKYRHKSKHPKYKYMYEPYYADDNGNPTKIRVNLNSKRKIDGYYVYEYKTIGKGSDLGSGGLVTKYDVSTNPHNLSKHAEIPDDVHYNHKKTKKNSRKNLSKFRARTLSLINQDREDTTGNAPLQESSALDQIAQIRAKDASTPAQENQSDPHMDPATDKAYYEEVGNQLGYDVNAFGSDNHSASGENLAWGDTTPEDFNNAWYTQEKPYDGGHYQNIVGDTSTTGHYRLVGIGVYHDTGAEVFSENVSSNN